jgi:hypothetical protein
LALLAFTALGNAAQVHPLTIPAGATVRVRTAETIDVKNVDPGYRFAGNLTDPLKSAAGTIVIPAGSPVQLSVVSVKSSSRVKGRDRLSVKVDSVSYRGRTYSLVTNVSGAAGKSKGKRTLTRTGIGAGAGALIGGLAGGGTGLAVGALVGGGAGTAVAAATGGKHLAIPAESILSFQLQSAVTVR